MVEEWLHGGVLLYNLLVLLLVIISIGINIMNPYNNTIIIVRPFYFLSDIMFIDKIYLNLHSGDILMDWYEIFMIHTFPENNRLVKLWNLI